MHLIVCTAGTLLAMAAHLRQARIWVPHALGLLTMITVSYGVTATRWIGIVLLLSASLAVLPGLALVRQRWESVIDNVAMVMLIAAVPTMGMHAAGHHEMVDHAMSEPSTSLTVSVVTVLAWVGARIIVLDLVHSPSRPGGQSPGRATVALAGTALMVSGMTLMNA